MGRVRGLVGLLLVGYGILILSGVLAHEAPWAGAASLLVGLAVAGTTVPRLTLRRARLTAGLGAAILLSVLLYNFVRSSDFSAPETAMALYGVALVGASPFLSRSVRSVSVGTLVAWSFPLILAPLAVFALNAALSTPASGAAASPLILVTIVWPTVLALRLLGTSADLINDNVVLGTERGTLVVDIGLVCAGLYPMVLFGGIVALHAWRMGSSPRETAKLLGIGIVGLWFVNLLRLVALATIGVAWGPKALTSYHANLGWVLFGAFMLGFCLLFLRERPVALPTVALPTVPVSGPSSGAVPAPRAGTIGSWLRSVPKRP